MSLSTSVREFLELAEVARFVFEETLAHPWLLRVLLVDPVADFAFAESDLRS